MKGGWIPLSQDKVKGILAQKIGSLGLDPKKYKFHAFRRGGMHTGSKVVSNLELLPAESRFDVSEAIIEFLSN